MTRRPPADLTDDDLERALEEVARIARARKRVGAAKPAEDAVPKFDRKAYQRDYMKRWRAKQKVSK